LIKATDRALELARKEAAGIIESDQPTSLQEEQLISPIVKYLIAFSNQPGMCTETQVSKQLSVPRPMARRAIQALEAYGVIETIADFGTVKPYKPSRIEVAVKAAWVTFSPEEVRLLFSVRDGKRFSTSGSFEKLVQAEDGCRWVPPMEAASSFFSAMTGELALGTRLEGFRTAYEVDAEYLGGLLDRVRPLMTKDDLMMMAEKDEITQEDFAEARRKRIEKYCWIYFTVAERMLARNGKPRQEYLAFMVTILESCIEAAKVFGVPKERVQRGEQLLETINSSLQQG
jgi:hypothetical protein